MKARYDAATAQKPPEAAAFAVASPPGPYGNTDVKSTAAANSDWPNRHANAAGAAAPIRRSLSRVGALRQVHHAARKILDPVPHEWIGRLEAFAELGLTHDHQLAAGSRV